jgi:hypothetical protein
MLSSQIKAKVLEALDAQPAVLGQLISTIIDAYEANEVFVDKHGTHWQRPSAWAYFAACRALAERTQELRDHGIEPKQLEVEPNEPGSILEVLLRASLVKGPMTSEELEQQKQSWVRGEMALGNDTDEARFREQLARDQDPAHSILEEDLDKAEQKHQSQ